MQSSKKVNPPSIAAKDATINRTNNPYYVLEEAHVEDMKVSRMIQTTLIVRIMTKNARVSHLILIILIINH